MKKNYQGNELELFQHARNWKKYLSYHIRPYLHGAVLEVGAGIGSTTKALCDGSQDEWCCLEPDEKLYAIISEKTRTNQLPSVCFAVNGTLDDLPEDKHFDVILYIDVIEHIEKHKEELLHSCDHLKEGGFIVILVPAHQELYTPFDKAIGHYRRYDRESLQDIIPQGMKSIELKYLDSIGTFAVAFNKYILKQSYPSITQVQFWDQWIIPVSKIMDRILRNRAGKSLLGIWQKGE